VHSIPLAKVWSRCHFVWHVHQACPTNPVWPAPPRPPKLANLNNWLPWQRPSAPLNPHLTHDSLGPFESTAQTANWSVQPFLHSSQQKVPILYNGGPFPPKLSLLVGGMGTPSFSWFLEADPAHNPNCIMIASAIFAQVTVEGPYTLQWAPVSPKIAPSHGGSGPPCKTRFVGPIRAHRPNGISTGSAVFPQTTVECPYTLQWDAILPPNFPLPMGGSEPHLIHGRLGPPKSSTQMASWSI